MAVPDFSAPGFGAPGVGPELSPQRSQQHPQHDAQTHSPQPTDAQSAQMPSEFGELLEGSRVVSLPMRVKFRGVMHREIMLFRGPYGWGEFSPFLEYDDGEASAWLASALEAAHQPPVTSQRDQVLVNATVPAVPAAQVGSVLERFGTIGTVKIKVAERGQALEEDIARVQAVRALLPTAHLRVDANMGWDHATAVRALGRLAEFELEYAEQPVAGVEGLARLREALAAAHIPVKIAADESIRKAQDPLEVARLGAADLMVVKAAPLGGVRRALAIVKEAGLPAVVSSALDSSVGIAHGVRLAGALESLNYACGLGTLALMGGDVSEPSLRPRQGSLTLAAAAHASGQGVDPELLERFAVHPDREAWWRERARRSYTELLKAKAA